MIAPGAKRPPPMGSELLESEPEPEMGLAADEAERGLADGRGGGPGEIVGSSPIRVGAEPMSTAAPHTEQNFAALASSVPQSEQNI